jgi:hypothetical protein
MTPKCDTESDHGANAMETAERRLAIRRSASDTLRWDLAPLRKPSAVLLDLVNPLRLAAAGVHWHGEADGCLRSGRILNRSELRTHAVADLQDTVRGLETCGHSIELGVQLAGGRFAR